MSFYRTFQHMTWPVPGEALAELEHTMRYGTPTKADQMKAASVLSAYEMLVTMTAKERANRIRELRKGPNIHDRAVHPHEEGTCK